MATKALVVNPADFGIAESRSRKLFPFLKILDSYTEAQCQTALDDIEDLLRRMSENTTPVTLSDILLEETHPIILAWLASQAMESPPERFQPKRRRTSSATSTGGSEPDNVPQWWSDHAQECANLGFKWVHPSKNKALETWAAQHPCYRALPWREKDAAWILHLKFPHPGDFMTDPLSTVEEQCADVSQELPRLTWHSGSIGGLTTGAVVILRFRKRTVHPVEKIRLHGFYTENDDSHWTADATLSTLAGLGYNSFVTGALFMASQIYMPEQHIKEALGETED